MNKLDTIFIYGLSICFIAMGIVMLNTEPDPIQPQPVHLYYAMQMHNGCVVGDYACELERIKQ